MRSSGKRKRGNQKENGHALHLRFPFQVTSALISILEEHLPSWDKTNAATLGFHTGAPGVDGLDLGVATLGINISLATKQTYEWAFEVPEDIFYEYVVTFAHANEARSNWRPFLTEVVGKILNGSEPKTVAEVVSVTNSGPGKRKGGQDPRLVELFSPEFCLKIGDTFVQAMRKPTENGKKGILWLKRLMLHLFRKWRGLSVSRGSPWHQL